MHISHAAGAHTVHPIVLVCSSQSASMHQYCGYAWSQQCKEPHYNEFTSAFRCASICPAPPHDLQAHSLLGAPHCAQHADRSGKGTATAPSAVQGPAATSSITATAAGTSTWQSQNHVTHDAGWAKRFACVMQGHPGAAVHLQIAATARSAQAVAVKLSQAEVGCQTALLA